MRELNNKELMNVDGGGWSGTLFNSISRAIDTVMNVGRSLGSAIRRLVNGSICPV